MIAVLEHELKNHFHSLTAYVFGAFLLMFIGLGAMYYNLEQAYSNFEYVFGYISIIFCVIVPLLTMRVIAEERKQRTDQLLYSLPISTTQVVIGKYLALLVMYLIPLVIVAFYPLIFAQYGDVYLPTSYGSLVAMFLMGAALIAVGVFLSSLTENQMFAAGLGFVVILLNYYSVSLSEYVSATATGSIICLTVLSAALGLLIAHLTRNETVGYGIGIALIVVIIVVSFINRDAFEGLLPKIMTQLSLFERLYVFINGIFDMTGICYYLSVIVFFLFLSVQSLEKRRYN